MAGKINSLVKKETSKFLNCKESASYRIKMTLNGKDESEMTLTVLGCGKFFQLKLLGKYRVERDRTSEAD